MHGLTSSLETVREPAGCPGIILELALAEISTFVGPGA
jgi:hypothetical protein